VVQAPVSDPFGPAVRVVGALFEDAVKNPNTGEERMKMSLPDTPPALPDGGGSAAGAQGKGNAH
jgi:hypothetical protein